MHFKTVFNKFLLMQAFLIPATVLVVYIRPSAASSGMPELIGYLNGTLVRHIFQLKTLLVKFVSCGCAVGSGMPVGPEGPMIHMGALVGAGVSNFGSRTLGVSGCVMPFFMKFHNSKVKQLFFNAVKKSLHLLIHFRISEILSALVLPPV